ncbi:hypothetical protein [Paracoccus sp. Ld10]|uniref:hypothetical protein n=1 Tax=Paracoccus sp. Ld10 TaxID=649158 RepID=UPI003864DF07
MIIDTDLPPALLRRTDVTVGRDAARPDLIVPLARQMHRESLFADLPFDQPQIERMLGLVHDDSGYHGAVVVACEAEPVAFALFEFEPMRTHSASWITVIHTAHIRSDIRETAMATAIWHRVILAVRGWSAPRGVRGIQIALGLGVAVPRMDALLTADGATPLGGAFFSRQ